MTALSRISLSRFRVALVLAAIAWGGGLASLAPADTVPPNPTIALQNAVHFLTPAGEDLVVAPGTYEVDAAKEGLRLKPTGGKEAEAVLVQAQALPHGESLTAPKVDVRPAGEDQYRVALLLPDGTSLEAVGSYSGVRTRGLDSTSTAYGTGALSSNTTGQYNTAVGSLALHANTTGGYNTAVGGSALALNTAGGNNTAVGLSALNGNTTGYWNTAVGSLALSTNTTGANNTAVGTWALRRTTGAGNTAVGAMALSENKTGANNTAMGLTALMNNTTGTFNTAVGVEALQINTTASWNTAVGFHALQFNTTGENNTAVGNGALEANSTGTINAAMGAGALQHNTTGSANTALGMAALATNTTGNDNTATGTEALKLNTSGGGNTAMGRQALSNNTIGGGNTAVGFQALLENLSSSNTAMGRQALILNVTGLNNTAVGDSALSHNARGYANLAIGAGAGSALVTGSNNIYVGNVGADESGTIRIGQQLSGKGGLLQTRAFLAGVAGVPVSGSVVQVDANGQLGITPSSRRYKEAIENMGTASQGLLHLRPVTFRYTPEVATGERQREYGLIAEEVAEVYPELVGHNADGQIVTVQYHELIPMLLNELQEQHRQLEALPELREQLHALTARVAELEAK